MGPHLAAGFHPVRLVVALAIALGLASTPIRCGLAAGPHSLFVPVDGRAADPHAGHRVAIVIDHGGHHAGHVIRRHDATATAERAPATPLEAGMSDPSASSPAEAGSPAAPLPAVLPDPPVPDRAADGGAVAARPPLPAAASVTPDVPPPKRA